MVMESEGGVPLRGLLAGYLHRLLSHYEISNRLMELILVLMSVDDRQRLVDYMYGLDKGRGEDWLKENSNYDTARENLFNPGSIDSGLLEDIYRGNLSRPKAEITSYIAGFLREKHELILRECGEPFLERMRELVLVFSLDESDQALLCFLYCHSDANVSCFENLSSDFSFHEFLAFCSAATGISYEEVKHRLGYNGRLFKGGILTEIDTGHQRYFTIDSSITSFMVGISEKTLVEKCLRRDWGNRLGLDCFTVDREKTAVVLSLLESKRACNILLHGRTGTGKTEFARAAAASAGRDVYFVNFSPSMEGQGGKGDAANAADRLLALRVGINAVSSDRGVLIVDEADFVLNTRSMYYSVSNATEKGWLNGFLDACQATIIWISNEVGLMEESTLRRFSYSVYFPEFTEKERKRVWENRLADHPLSHCFTKGMIRRLAAGYRVNAGAIASALDALVNLYPAATPNGKVLERTLGDILASHEELITGAFEKNPKSPLAGLVQQYDVSVLHTDLAPPAVLTAVRSFAGPWKRRSGTRGNLNLLFWGPPGTGKTEFAKYLARNSGLELMVKRYSDLESMYLGETEKKIAAAFLDAARNKAILFIDEADSFFTSRENAFRSWEISRTNEFLTQMENHDGILVCCTNLLPTMDSAAMRRFSWKVQFKALRDDDKLTLYARYFKGGTALTREQDERIMAIPGLTIGDIKTVWQRCRHFPGPGLDHNAIIEELKKEVGYRNTGRMAAIGFS